MPRILGYGEDALTLWAIGCQLGALLLHLDDPSPESEAVVMYRPSFGRGRRRGAGEAAGPSAEFGEFDAIVGTPRRVYLIESKWEGSSEIEPDGRIRLRPEQIRRHGIFQWYLRTWREAAPAEWTAFVRQSDSTFRGEFPGNKMAPAGSRLAYNLEFVLAQLIRCGSETKNVLLFFHFLEQPTATGMDGPDFRFVPVRATTLPDSMYLDIALPDLEMANAEKRDG